MTQSEGSTLSPPHLPVVRYELAFRAVEPVLLPAFAGAVWRGVLGAALKRIADGSDPAPVGFHPDAAKALYRDFFETPLPPGAAKMRLYKTVPHPYVVAAPFTGEPLRLAPGDGTVVGLSLVGRANEALPAIVAGFRRAAEAGLGKTRGRMTLEAVDAVWDDHDGQQPVYRPGHPVAPVSVAAPVTPPLPRFVVVHLASPLRLAKRGHPIGPEVFQPGDLLSSVVRRASMLSEFHAEPLVTDFRALKTLWLGARMIERDLDWYDQHRWSASQKEEIAMGGLVGFFVIDMAGLEPLWPYLWLGQWIHAGKGTVSGLGGILLQPA